jgi:hypothetical protein
MGNYEKAVKIVEKHEALTLELDQLYDKINNEKESINIDELKLLLDGMTLSEGTKFYRSLQDSDLKFELFLYIKSRSESTK